VNGLAAAAAAATAAATAASTTDDVMLILQIYIPLNFTRSLLLTKGQVVPESSKSAGFSS